MPCRYDLGVDSSVRKIPAPEVEVRSVLDMRQRGSNSRAPADTGVAMHEHEIDMASPLIIEIQYLLGLSF